MSRVFFASRVSGMYFLHSLRRLVAWFLSIVWLNWAMVGGTFKRHSMIRFWRWRRTYLGHLMKRVRLRFGFPRTKWCRRQLLARFSLGRHLCLNCLGQGL